MEIVPYAYSSSTPVSCAVKVSSIRICGMKIKLNK